MRVTISCSSAPGPGHDGLAIAQAAFGITPIMVDVDDDKLEAAKASGAADAVNATTPTPRRP